jgi:DNA-binding NarL/FixJ family response regulator
MLSAPVVWTDDLARRAKQLGIPARKADDVSGQAMEGQPASVVIVDDHKLFAEAVKSALERLGMMVTGVATAEDAEQVVQSTQPDIVLLDIGPPHTDRLALAERLMALHPRLKVVAVTSSFSSKLVQEALRRGIHGYLTKDASMSQLAESFQAAMSGGVLITQRLARAAAGSPAMNEGHVLLLADQLTDREMEVLGLLANGATSAQIAARLGLRRNTVRTHVQAILTKLQVHSRLEAVAFAVRHGLVTVNQRRP